MSLEMLDDNVAFDAPAPEVDRTAVSIRRSIASVETSLTEFEKISAGLEALREQHPVDLVFDVTTTKGMQEAVAHRAAWRDPRITVEKFRKAAKAPVLTLGKDIDARAAWLTEQLLLGETPVHEQIKVEEVRKAQEKADKEAKEFGRIVSMQEAIAELAMTAMVAGKSSADIGVRLDAMKATQLDPLSYQEMMPQAQAARLAAIDKLEQGLKAAQWDEAETARRAAEAEAARIKRAAEDAERARVSAEQAAEQARVAEEQRVERERLDAERVELARQRAELDAERAAAVPAPAPAVAAIAQTEPAAGYVAPVMVLTTTASPAKPVITADLTAAEPFLPAVTEDPTLTLGDIKDRIAPLSITAEGLLQLGFAHAATKGASKLYTETQFQAICLALVEHIAKMRDGSEA